MRALRTIVATAVIVFTLTTVAMAGVQHSTKQSDQKAGTQAQQAQLTYSVTLTAAQLKRLIDTQASGTMMAEAHADRTHRNVERVRDTVRATARHQTRNQDQTRDHSGAAQTGSAASGSHNSGTGTCAPKDYDHDYDWGSSGDGQHHSGDGDHHSGDGSGGCR